MTPLNGKHFEVLRIKYQSEFDKVSPDEQQELIDSKYREFENTYLNVVMTYFHTASELDEDIKKELTTKEQYYKDKVFDELIKYWQSFSTSVVNWDDIKITYFLGLELAASTNKKEYINLMLDVLNITMESIDVEISRDMVSKIKKTVAKFPVVDTINSASYLGKYGIYFMYKNAQHIHAA